MKENAADFSHDVNTEGPVQAEARERKEGSLKEVALLSMELEELRSADFETKYEDAKEQVRFPGYRRRI
jgi:hypothetical protein